MHVALASSLWLRDATGVDPLTLPAWTAPDATSLSRAFALARRHGWNATSFQVLDPGFRYWFAGAGDDDDGVRRGRDGGDGAAAAVCGRQRERERGGR